MYVLYNIISFYDVIVVLRLMNRSERLILFGSEIKLTDRQKDANCLHFLKHVPRERNNAFQENTTAIKFFSTKLSTIVFAITTHITLVIHIPPFTTRILSKLVTVLTRVYGYYIFNVNLRT